MEKSPFLSIIVPVYKTQAYLAPCLDSILNQTFTDYELICVNDGSPDNSQEILDEYARKNDCIKIIRQENSGLSQARNSALDIATGEWILFIDSDDKLGADGVTTGRELHELICQIEDDIDWIITTPTVVYEGEIYMDKRKSDLRYFSLPFYGSRSSNDIEINKINVCVWGKLFKRSLIEKENLRFPKGLRYEDEFWFPCYRLLSKRVKCVRNKLYTYYRRNEGIMYDTYKNKTLSSAKDRLMIAEQVINFYSSRNRIEDNKDYLDKLFWRLVCSAYKLCPDSDVLYCQWLAGAILRNTDYPCLSNKKFADLKNGYFVQIKKDSFLKKLRRILLFKL